MQNIQFSTDTFNQYLCEIGRVPLLSHEQEIIYGKQVQKSIELISSKSALAAEVGHEPSLSEWAAAVNSNVLSLQKNIALGEKAKRQMTEANLRLVISVAKNYTSSSLDLLDLIQEGSIGLQRAVEKFDPSKGYRFSTYAYWWIRQAIIRAIAEKSRTIRLPIHVTEKLNKIKKTRRLLSQELGRPVTMKELSAELELDPKEIRKYLECAHQPLSLDLKVGDQKDTELGDLLENTEISPEEYAISSSLQEDLAKMLATLTPQQQQILKLHFGLNEIPAHSLAQIGKLLNMSRERVWQIQQDAINRLRRRKEDILEYLVS